MGDIGADKQIGDCVEEYVDDGLNVNVIACVAGAVVGCGGASFFHKANVSDADVADAAVFGFDGRIGGRNFREAWKVTWMSHRRNSWS